MHFFTSIVAALFYSTPSFSVLLFMISACLLLIGMAVLIHAHAVLLRFLEDKPLNWIEKTHPHLPSPRAIVTIAMCSTTLLLVALQTVQGTFPFNDPYEGLNLTSFFFLATAIGILAELKWKGARDYAFAVIVGTASAYLLLLMQLSNPPRPLGERIFLIALLLPSILLIGQTVMPAHRRSVIFTVALSFGFWILLYLIH